MNKGQRRFWYFWGVVGTIAGISIISPVAGLVVFMATMIGATATALGFLLREIYRDIGD